MKSDIDLWTWNQMTVGNTNVCFTRKLLGFLIIREIRVVRNYDNYFKCHHIFAWVYCYLPRTYPENK